MTQTQTPTQTRTPRGTKGLKATLAAMLLSLTGLAMIAVAASSLDDVHVDPAYSGYASDPISDDKVGNIVVDILDANGNVIIDDEGSAVRVKVSPFDVPPSRQLTVYRGTSTDGARYGIADAYQPDVTMFAAVVLSVSGVAACVVARVQER